MIQWLQGSKQSPHIRNRGVILWSNWL